MHKHRPHILLLAAGLVAAQLLVPARPSLAQGSGLEQNELALYQLRISAIEQSLKEINARLEEELFALREAVEGNDLLRRIELRLNEIGAIGSEIRAISNKLERTLQIATDNEFRIQQLEAQLALLSTSDGVTTATTPPSVDLTTRDQLTGSLTSDSPDAQTVLDSLDSLAGDIANNQDPVPLSQQAAGDELPSASAESLLGGSGQAADSLAELLGESQQPILPPGSEEDQYQYALDLALKNRLENAEQAFAALVERYPEGARRADSMYWLGRIQFLRGAYQEAVISLSEFSQRWPDDPRRAETTIWMAESLSEFAPRDQACAIFGRLTDTFSEPPAKLVERLRGLERKVGCN